MSCHGQGFGCLNARLTKQAILAEDPEELALLGKKLPRNSPWNPKNQPEKDFKYLMWVWADYDWE